MSLSWCLRIGCTISRVSPASSGSGLVQVIWCSTGMSGISIPAIRPTFGPQMPAQINTRSVAILPLGVTTAWTRPFETSIAKTGVRS
jgi:hypothetical protein